MTEDEWLECDHPRKMLEFLTGKTSDRKLRLFALACCRLCWSLLKDKRFRIALRKLEQFADAITNDKLRQDAYNAANSAYATFCGPNNERYASCAVVCAAERDIPPNLEGNISHALELSQGLSLEQVLQLESDILRHLIGNPFRPITLDPTWQTTTVVSLAQAIYDERAVDRLPILADALEDAGCSSQDILNHCRQPGEHVRGCWSLDLVLGKK